MVWSGEHFKETMVNLPAVMVVLPAVVLPAVANVYVIFAFFPLLE